jgi:hypothetical protein
VLHSLTVYIAGPVLTAIVSVGLSNQQLTFVLLNDFLHQRHNFMNTDISHLQCFSVLIIQHETCLWQDWNVYCTEVTGNTPTRPQ